MVYYKTIKDFYFNIANTPVLLGIDYGQKKVGLSTSDKSNSIALAYKTIYQKDNGKYYIKFKRIITQLGKELTSVHSGNTNPIKLPAKLPYLTIFRVEAKMLEEN